MALLLNGTSDCAIRALDLSAYNKVSISYWYKQATNATNDKLLMEFTASANTNNGGFFIDPNNGGGAGTTAIKTHSAAGDWSDHFTTPSAGAWHHILITLDRSTTTPAWKVYVDGSLVSTSTDVHNTGTYGVLANSTLFIGCRNQASLFFSGSIAELTIWGGILLGATDATSLNSGTVPTTVHASADLYVIQRGQSTVANEATDGSGNGRNLTITGCTYDNDPSAISGITVVSVPAAATAASTAPVLAVTVSPSAATGTAASVAPALTLNLPPSAMAAVAAPTSPSPQVSLSSPPGTATAASVGPSVTTGNIAIATAGQATASSTPSGIEIAVTAPVCLGSSSAAAPSVVISETVVPSAALATASAPVPNPYMSFPTGSATVLVRL